MLKTENMKVQEKKDNWGPESAAQISEAFGAAYVYDNWLRNEKMSKSVISFREVEALVTLAEEKGLDLTVEKERKQAFEAYCQENFSEEAIAGAVVEFGESMRYILSRRKDEVKFLEYYIEEMVEKAGIDLGIFWEIYTKRLSVIDRLWPNAVRLF